MKFVQPLILILILSCAGFAQNSHNSWLRGTWTGDGVQMDGATWSMKLRVVNKKYVIEYPSLKCRGYWNLIGISSKKARFIERIPNSSVCLDRLTVEVERGHDGQINVKFSSAADKFAATAVLRRSGRKQIPAAGELLINYEKQT